MYSRTDPFSMMFDSRLIDPQVGLTIKLSCDCLLVQLRQMTSQQGLSIRLKRRALI